MINGQIGFSFSTFNTTSAETDGYADPSNPCNSVCGDAQIWRDVWYRYHAPVPDTGPDVRVAAPTY